MFSRDHSSGRMYRFSPSAYEIIGRARWEAYGPGVWEKALSGMGMMHPHRGGGSLLSQLHAADALICDISPDTRRPARRQNRSASMSLRRTLLNPLALKILWDPEAFLTIPLSLKPLSGIGVLLWLAVWGQRVLGYGIFPN